MNKISQSRSLILLVGDIFALAIVTVTGFATHGELPSAGMRLLSTFIPLLISWLVLGPAFLVFDAQIAANPRQLWRILWAAVAMAPLAALLRGLWLNSPIIPVFVLVLGGFGALALLLWRIVFIFLMKR